MDSVCLAKQSQAAELAIFQCQMAMETEKLQLNKGLVEDAIIFLSKHPKYGQFFISVNSEFPERPLGSLLITYENSKSWWMQSVYVVLQERRKGRFTAMFKAAIQQAKVSGASSVKLYVEKQNDRARKTYENLGMHVNGQLFYGCDIVYGDCHIREQLQQKLNQQFQIGQSDNEGIEQFSMEQKIFGSSQPLNYRLECRKKGKICGFCEYFYEFSDWRFGLMLYFNILFIKGQEGAQIMKNFVKYVYSKSEIKIAAIRFIIVEHQLEKLQKIVPQMHLDAYNVMMINL